MSAIDLINNEDGVSGAEMNAELLADVTRLINDDFGMFGRFVIVGTFNSQTLGQLNPIITTAIMGGGITTVYPREET